MIRLSVENNDAIMKNLYIHSYDPAMDKMVFGQSLGLDIVRHSLSFDNIREAELVISEIIRYISKETCLPPLVFTGWPSISVGNTPAQTRSREHRYKQSGYEIESSGDHKLAIGSHFTDLEGFDLKQVLSGASYVMWACRNVILDELALLRLKGLVLSCGRAFSAPDNRALEGLGDQFLAVGYMLSSDAIRPGFVLLSKSESGLSFDKEIMKKLNIHVGDSDFVWRN